MRGLFCEYSTLEYVRVPAIYRVIKAEYGIHIRVAASQEYVHKYSTRRDVGIYICLLGGLHLPLWANPCRFSLYTILSLLILYGV